MQTKQRTRKKGLKNTAMTHRNDTNIYMKNIHIHTLQRVDIIYILNKNSKRNKQNWTGKLKKKKKEFNVDSAYNRYN